MANPLTIPGDLIVPGDLRVAGSITPAKARSDVLELQELATFTIPMEIWNDHGEHNNMTPGTGISTGTDTVCGGHVSRDGSLIKTEIFIDMDGLKSGATIGDIIGVAAAKNCYIGKITAAVNGTIVFGQITCLETPAGGDPDVDFYSTVTEATGTQDAAISALTGEVAFTNNGDWTGAIATPIVFTALPGVGYMYMVDAGGTAVEYTAGQFLLEFWGTPATKTLNYVPGTHATNAPSLQTDNCAMNDAAVVYYARGEIQLPAEYVAGQSIEIRVHAGMLTTVADQACTVDIAVYKSDEDSTSTGDLCADAAVGDNMNSVTFADIDFTITPSTLSPGDLLDVQITVSADDNATATVVKGCIGSVQLLCDVARRSGHGHQETPPTDSAFQTTGAIPADNGRSAQLLVPGIFPYCAMMQIAAEDTECDYVVCRGYDPRDKRYYDYDGGDEPGIAVAKPYGSRCAGVYRIGEVYPAVLPLSARAEDDGKIVPYIGQNPGRAEGDACKGHPLDLTEEIVHIQDGDDVYINWMLLDGGGAQRKVYFELLEALVQWAVPPEAGSVVNAARKTWDPTANDGWGGFTVDCADQIKVGDLNRVGHNAGAGGFGCGIMHATEDEPYWVCVIDDLCCPGEEQGECA